MRKNLQIILQYKGIFNVRKKLGSLLVVHASYAWYD